MNFAERMDLSKILAREIRQDKKVNNKVIITVVVEVGAVESVDKLNFWLVMGKTEKFRIGISQRKSNGLYVGIGGNKK